jgi:multicomponent K+:H+ antiporter subunit E
MRRLLPAPLISATLFTFWLLLTQSLSPGSLLLASLLAVGMPLLTAKLRPVPVRLRRPLTVVRLIADVGYDIAESNLEVALGVLRSRRRPLQPAFVTIPLDLHDSHGLAALAVITTVVPGTVWSELAIDRSAVLLHVFDVDDQAAFVARYKARYERPLIEIFQ